MANKIYEETNIQNIATQIRAKNGTATTYKVSEMATAISNLQCLSEANATGTSLSLGASSNLPIKKLDLDGRCTQEGTPTPDNPQDIEVIDGYNLLPNNATTQTINGVTFTKNSDGTILLNGTSNSQIELLIGTTTLSSGSYYASNGVSGSTSTYYIRLGEGTTSSSTFIANVGIGDNQFTLATQKLVGAVLIVRNGQTLNNILFKPMISKKGGQYLPYGNIGVNVNGKNYLDLSIFAKANDYYSISNNNIIVSSQDSRLYTNINYYLTLKQGTYTLVSKTQIPRLQLTNRTSGIVLINELAQYVVNFTLEEDSKVCVKFLGNGTFPFTIEKPMLLKGTYTSYSETYEEYKNQSVAIDLQNNFIGKIGDIKDKLKIENGNIILTKRIGKVVLDGSENWNLSAGTTLFHYVITEGFSGITKNWGFMCDYFKQSNWDDRLINGNGGLYSNAGWNNARLFLNNANYNNVNDFKAWLSNNNVKVYCELTTPYEVDLGSVPTPHTYQSASYITNTSDTNMDLDYYIVR